MDATDMKPGDLVRVVTDRISINNGTICTIEAVVGDASLILSGYGPRRYHSAHFERVETLGDIIKTTPFPPAADPVHHPVHYTRYDIQPIEFIMRNNLPFWLGNVIKYAMRYDAKDGLQDLKKAERYLKLQIKTLEGETDFGDMLANT